ncbi:MAG: bifunctional riboflavin kinase/FAD synthetase [Blastocatellia bacterium]
MKIFHGINHSDLLRPTVLTLGVFDGLHIGHQAIVRRVVDRAALLDATPTLVTFDPHPRQVLHPATAPPLLQTFSQKMEGLKQLGVRQVIVLEFTRELAALTAAGFVQAYLHDALAAREIYLGHGFFFGRDRLGNIEMLREIGQRLGFFADEVAEVRARSQRVSSTRVRQALRDGRVNLARRMLGRAYGVEGVVVEGRRVGRTISFPTANLDIQNRVLPADGVYVTLALADGTWHRSVTNIGRRPTLVGDTESKAETHLIDFDGDLYGKTLRVRFLYRLRGEMKFSGIDELKAQITRDRDRTVRYFRSDFVRRNLGYI